MRPFQILAVMWWVPIAFVMEFVISVLAGSGGQGAGILIAIIPMLAIVGVLVDVLAFAILQRLFEGNRTTLISAFVARAVLIACAAPIPVAMLAGLAEGDSEDILFLAGHVLFVYSLPMSMIACYAANQRTGNWKNPQAIALGVSLAAALLWDVSLWFGIAPWA